MSWQATSEGKGTDSQAKKNQQGDGGDNALRHTSSFLSNKIILKLYRVYTIEQHNLFTGDTSRV